MKDKIIVILVLIYRIVSELVILIGSILLGIDVIQSILSIYLPTTWYLYMFVFMILYYTLHSVNYSIVYRLWLNSDLKED